MNSLRTAVPALVLAVTAGLALGAGPVAATSAEGATTAPRTAAPDLQEALDQMVEDGAPGALLYTYDCLSA
jgi:hypothetical protein